MTIPELKQNPQETSAFYLAQLFELQLSAYNNGSTTFIRDQPPSSSPDLPLIATAVNALLFICLSLNLFAAMLALLLQQWTHHYLMLTHSLRSSSEFRARVREAFGGGPQKSPISSAVRVSMTLLFVSMVTFFIAISFYLNLLNRPVNLCFYICSVGCSLIFAPIKFMPGRALHLSFIAFMHPLQVVPEKPVWKSAKDIDDRILDHIFRALRPENSDLVRFGKEKVNMAVKKLVERTWSSNSLSSSDRTRLVVTCVEFAEALRLSDVASSILEVILPLDQHQLLTLVEMGRSLRTRGNRIGLCGQSLVAGIISNVQPGDHSLISLAADQLGKSEDVIRGYLQNGRENVLLANLIHITHQILQSSCGDGLNLGRDMAATSSIILPTLSNFDIRHTLPELKRDFGVLWDEIDRESSNNRVVMKIRDSLRGLRDESLPQRDGLPPGWEVRQTPDGCTYYVDHNTPNTTLIPPSINPSNDDLPPGWEVRQTGDGRTYYIDHNMQRTTWIPPPDPPPYIAPPTSPSREVLVPQQAPAHINSTPTTTVSSHLNDQPLQGDGRPQSGTSQAIASATTTTTANIAGSSGTALPNPRSVLPASTHPRTSVSMTPSPTHATSHAPSVFRPDAICPTPLGARHDSQEPDRDNSTEMRSFDQAEPNRDPSDNPDPA